MSKNVETLQIVLEAVTDKFGPELQRANDRIDKFRDELAGLKDRYDGVRKEQKRATEQSKVLREENRRLKDSNKALAAQMTNTNRHLESAEKTNAALAQSVAAATSATNATTQATQNLGAAAAATAKGLARAEKSATGLASEYGVVGQGAQALVSSHSELEAEIGSVQAQYEQAIRTGDKYYRGIHSLETVIKTSTMQLEMQRDALNSVELAEVKLQKRFDSGRMSVEQYALASERLIADKTKLSAGLQVTTTRLGEQRRELTAVRAGYNESRQAAVTLDGSLKGLNADFRKQQSTIAAVNLATTEASTKTARLTEATAKSTVGARQATSSYSRMQSEIDQLNAEFGLTIGQINTSTPKLKAMAGVMGTLSKSAEQTAIAIERLGAEQSATKERLKTFNATLAQSKAHLDYLERATQATSESIREYKLQIRDSVGDTKAAEAALASLSADHSRLQDDYRKTSSTINIMEAAIKKSTAELAQADAQTTELTAEKRRLENQLKEVGTQFKREEIAANKAARKLRDVDGAAQSLIQRIFHKNSALRKSQAAFGKVTQAVYNLRLGYLAATTAGALLAKNALSTAVRFDNMRLTAIAATGSLQGASLQMAKSVTIAQRYGLAVEEVTKSYGKFMAAARGTRLEGAAADAIFNSAAKAAKAYGLSNEELEGTLKALEQMVSKGTVQMEELKNQLGDRLPGALGIAARAMNMTRSELFKMIEQGQLAAEDFLPKFADELNKATAESIEFAKNSPGAEFQKLANSIKLVEASLANSGLVSWLADASAGLSAFIDRFSYLDRMGEPAVIVKMSELRAEIAKTKVELDKANAPAKNFLYKVLNQSQVTEILSAKLTKLNSDLAKATTRYKQLNGELSDGSGLEKSVSSIGTLSGTTSKFIQDMVKDSSFGVDKFTRKINEMSKSYEIATADIKRALAEQRDAIAATQATLSNPASDAKQIASATGRLKALREIEASTNRELLQLTENYNNTKAEWQRKSDKDALARQKERSRAIVEQALEEAKQRSKIEQLLGNSLSNNLTGKGLFKDVQVPEVDLIAGLTSQEEFANYAKSIGESFGGIARAAQSSVDVLKSAGLSEVLMEQLKNIGEFTKGLDLNYEALVPKVPPASYAELVANQEKLYSDIQARNQQFADDTANASMLPDPEKEALRAEVLTQLNAQFGEYRRTADIEYAQSKADMLSQMTGLEAGYYQNIMRWEELSAATKLQTAAATFSNLISLSGTKSKKLMKIAAVADAAQTIAMSFKLAVGAAADTPGDPYTRAAAYASALAMGLGAVAKLKSAYSSAGASSGGGGGSGGAGASVSSSNFNTTGVSSASNEPSAFDKADRALTIELRNLDPDAQYSGRQIERIIDGINEAYRDGRGTIEVTQ